MLKIINITSNTPASMVPQFERHNEAITQPNRWERPIIRLIECWESYAINHNGAYESRIGEDAYMAAQWAQIAKGIRGILNGQTSRLDCGSLDSYILKTAKEHGVDPERAA